MEKMKFLANHAVGYFQKMYKKYFLCLNMILLNSYAIFKTICKDRAFHVLKQKLSEEIIEQNIQKIKTH